MWNERKLPQEFKDASIVHLYKWKGNKLDCNNHWGISGYVAGEILARILPNRLTDISNRKTFYRRANVDSGMAAVQWT